MHMPIAQVPGQALPQPPQFMRSDWRLAQAAPQRICPVGHMPAQVPLAHS